MPDERTDLTIRHRYGNHGAGREGKCISSMRNADAEAKVWKFC